MGRQIYVSRSSIKQMLGRRKPDDGVLPLKEATLLALYPFLLVSVLETWESANWSLISRLAVAAVFNLAFFVTLLAAVRTVPVRALAIALDAMFWLFLALFTFASVYHFCLYGQLLGITSLYSAIDTNWHELAEFVHSYFKPDALLMATLAAIPLAWQAQQARRLRPISFCHPTRSAFCLSLCLALGLIGLQKPFLYNNNPLLFIAQTFYEVGDQKREMAEASAMLSRRDLHRAFDRSEFAASKEPVVHVLVLGEATTSRHMSLYGYRRPTTPTLEAMREKLHIATNACASRGVTILALQELLTFATRDDRAPLFSMPNIIEIMKQAGYKTYWLSNQQPIGFGDTWGSIFANSADVRLFVNKRGWTSGVSLDEKLLGPFAEALSEPATKKFIVVHLIGSHAAYALRYPPAFQKFSTNATEGAPETVKALGGSVLNRLMVTSGLSQYNAYDNSVLYNDYIVSELIGKTLAIPYSTLTYTSDHGEAVFEVRGVSGHVDGVMPRQVYEVPLFFSLAPKVSQKLDQQRLTAFAANLNRPFQTDLLIHTLLDLYRVQHAGRQATHSLLDPHYQSAPRFCDTLKD